MTAVLAVIGLGLFCAAVYTLLMAFLWGLSEAINRMHEREESDDTQ